MARGTKMEYDVDDQNRMILVLEFLADEWDSESSVGTLSFRYREDAMVAVRKWLNKQINDINDLALVDELR